ncbi:MAG: hypothetical protein ACYDDZ_13940, partial [Acidimicrobiales bacterium]
GRRRQGKVRVRSGDEPTRGDLEGPSWGKFDDGRWCGRPTEGGTCQREQAWRRSGIRGNEWWTGSGRRESRIRAEFQFE